MRIRNKYESEIKKFKEQRNLSLAVAFVFFVLWILTVAATSN